MLSGPFLAD